MTSSFVVRRRRTPVAPAIPAALAVAVVLGCGGGRDDGGAPGGDAPDEDTTALSPAPGPLDRLRARLPDSVLVRRGACPFECCAYRRWASPEDIPLRAGPDAGLPVAAAIPGRQPFRADSGFVRIEGLLLVLPRDTIPTSEGPAVPGDTLVLLDYQGEGIHNAWHRGRVVWIDALPGGGRYLLESADTVGSYRRSWWVHASAPGGVGGWFDADRVERIEGADLCGGPDPEGLTGFLPGEARPEDEWSFDPSDLSPGDSVLGMEVVEMDVGRATEDSVWTGRVRFSGSMELEGVYQRHPDGDADAPCMEVDPRSRRRPPVFLPDDLWATGRRSWFCFRNAAEARRMLGPADPPRRVTVVVDRWEATRLFSDAWDTAELIEVVTVGGEAPATLASTTVDAWYPELRPRPPPPGGAP